MFDTHVRLGRWSLLSVTLFTVQKNDENCFSEFGARNFVSPWSTEKCQVVRLQGERLQNRYAVIIADIAQSYEMFFLTARPRTIAYVGSS